METKMEILNAAKVAHTGIFLLLGGFIGHVFNDAISVPDDAHGNGIVSLLPMIVMIALAMSTGSEFHSVCLAVGVTIGVIMATYPDVRLGAARGWGAATLVTALINDVAYLLSLYLRSWTARLQRNI